MKRQKNMLVLLLVLVLLIGAVFAVSALTKEEEPDNNVQDLGEVIVAIDPNSVTSMRWNYSDEVSFSRVNDGWEYTADPDFPLDENRITAALNMLKSITAIKVIENVADWDQYGLEVPVCEVTINAGTSYALSFGSEAAVSGGQYFSIGDGNVYIIDKNYMEPFSVELYDLLVTESIPAMDSVTGLEIKTASGTSTISREENGGKSYSDRYVWFLHGEALDTELTDALVSTVTSLSWKKCSNFHAADLSVYGLDTPAAVVRIDHAAGSFALEIGNASGDDYFAKLPGSNMIYVIDGSIGNALLNASYETLMPDDVLALDWDALESMEVTLNGTSYTMDGNSTDISGIITALDEMTSAGYAAETLPERSKEIRFLFHQNHSAYPQVELVFYQYDGDVCLVTLNGNSTVFVSRTQVVELVEAVNHVVLG